MCLSGSKTTGLWIMPYFFHYTWILPLCMGTIISVVDMEQTVNFNWNRSNPMFRPDEGAALTMPIGSSLKLVCPNHERPDEYYTVYWLPVDAFENCFKPTSGADLFVNCSKPDQGLSFTQQIVFFSGVPGGKEFKVGQHYYIATLSTGTRLGLTNEFEGACKEHHMKLNLTITDQVIPSTQAPPVSTPSTPKPKVTTTQQPTTSTTTRQTTTTKPTTTPSTTVSTTTKYPIDIPDPTDIVIEVPDNPNTGIIDANSASALTYYIWALLPSLCLSLLHIASHVTIFGIQR